MRFVWGFLAGMVLAAQAGAGVIQVFFTNATRGEGDIRRVIGRHVAFDLYDPVTKEHIYHGETVTEDYSSDDVISFLEFPDDISGAYDLQVRLAGYLSAYRENGFNTAASNKIRFYLWSCPPGDSDQCVAGDIADTGSSENYVDEFDLFELLKVFGPNPYNGTSYADLNLDGYVDDQDIIAMIFGFATHGFGP